MVLAVASRFDGPQIPTPLTPLGDRIPVAFPVAVHTETPAAVDPFHADRDRDPRSPALRAAAARPLIATADQLAFAAKVQVAKPQAARVQQPEPVHSEQRPQQHGSHDDSDSPFSMKPGETAPKAAVRPMHASSMFEVPSAVAGEPIPAAKQDSNASTRPSNTVEDVTPTRPEVPAAPMKDISVRIQSEHGENVDVRILHRAGDVQIAVKSDSGETTQGLRHGLSELSDRLNATGYHADTWHPGQAMAAADNRADSGNSQQQQSQGDSQSHSGWSQQQGGRRDDNQSNRPHWIDELESNISSPAETGLFHGLIR
jgi:hypothetical protein